MAIFIHETKPIHSSENDNLTPSTFYFNFKVGSNILNHEYNSRESAIEGARALIRDVCKIFNLPVPDMSGTDWFNDLTRDDRLKENKL
jgi:hypothetical protein